MSEYSPVPRRAHAVQTNTPTPRQVKKNRPIEDQPGYHGIGLPMPQSVLRHRPVNTEEAPQLQTYTIKKGNRQFTIHTDVPPELLTTIRQTPRKAQRLDQLPEPEQEIEDEPETRVPTIADYEEPVSRPIAKPRKKRGSAHGLLYIGLGMIVMLLLWEGLTSLVSWVNYELDTLNYGNPRTFQMDGAFGHSDSQLKPTHLLILNFNRTIEVIELPGGDATHAKIYTVATLVDPGSEFFPVTATSKDVNGDGKPDLELHVKGSAFVLINTGSAFRSLLPGEHVNL